jgi:hypothetical protein
MLCTTRWFQYDLSKILGIIVVAGYECIQTTSQGINRVIHQRVLNLWECDVEASIQVFCRNISEVFRYKGECKEVGRRGLIRMQLARYHGTPTIVVKGLHVQIYSSASPAVDREV